MFEYINDARLHFQSAPVKRKKTLGIVLHHRAGWGDVVSEHMDSLARGWIGIGYNVYVRLDGSVWMGRGLDAIGSHCGRTTMKNLSDWVKAAYNNNETIGIGFEGYYHPGHAKSDTVMPQVQYDAGVQLIRDLLIAYPTVAFIRGHNQMPATNTACPGDYFPLANMIADGLAKPSGGAAFTVKRYLYYSPDPRFKGDDVKWLQTQLNANGATLTIDGDFGKITNAAVKAYQAKRGLAIDGIVGKNTTESLGGVWA